MKRTYLWILCIFLSSYGFALDLQRSLVEIYVFQKEYDYSTPWAAPKIHHSGGSGFVIAPNLIMTNAHVVAETVFIEVRLNGFSKRYPANVQLIGHDCDLALLSVDDQEFLQLASPVEFGEEVREGDSVTVMGYPLLQEGISLTQGIVSRTQVEQYVHLGVPLYCTQIDAAINPGNSGGPVVYGGKVVGVAFQGYFLLQNMGYMIPIPVIEHFLRDAEDGNYRGFPFLGVNVQALENPHMRSYLGMSEEQTGVMITEVFDGFHDLREKDVILKVDGYQIQNDGFIIMNHNRRLLGTHVVTSKYCDEVIEVEVLRDNEIQTVSYPLTITFADLHEFGDRPQYFIYGGIVFQPLSTNYLSDQEECSINGELYFSKGSPVVLLSRVLPDQVNLGYHHYKDAVVFRVNGIEVATIDEVISELEKNEVTFHKIELEDGHEIILHRKSCLDSHSFLLQRYGVNQDRFLGNK